MPTTRTTRPATQPATYAATQPARYLCATCPARPACYTGGTCPAVPTAMPTATLLAWAYRVATQPCVLASTEALASAEARIARLEAGTATCADVQGLLDWAEAYGWEA